MHDVSDKTSGLTWTFPKLDQWIAQCRRMGAKRTNTIVLYEHEKIFFSARMSWLFRTHGATDVRILNGCFTKWINERRIAMTGKSVDVNDKSPDGYDYQVNPEMFDDMRSVLRKSYDVLNKTGTHKDMQLLDPRGKAKFAEGTVPGFKNLFANEFLSKDETRFLSPTDMKGVFKNHGFDAEKPITFSCLTGAMACIAETSSRIAGATKTTVYDGSFQEYSKRTAPDLTDPNWESKFTF